MPANLRAEGSLYYSLQGTLQFSPEKYGEVLNFYEAGSRI